MAGSAKGRARKLSEKAAALLEVQDNREYYKKKSRSSTKANRTSSKKRAAESESSDLSDEGHPRARKRCRQPDPEEIDVRCEPSDFEPEIVEGEDTEIMSDNEVDEVGEDNENQLINPEVR
jgi:hypothetical protein